jgi:PAS domain S-box-containing protein
MIFLHSNDGTYLDCRASEVNNPLLCGAQVVGKNLKDVLPSDLADAFFDCFRRAKQTGEPQIYEYSLPRQDTQYWFEARIIYTSGDQFLSVVRNVTERKRAEAQLLDSEARFRNMADSAPVMIWVTGPDKLCTWVNKLWLDFVGSTMQQETGDGWADNLHADDVDRSFKTYSDAFDARQSFSMEYRVKCHDGEYRWVLAHGTPVNGSDGAFAGYIGSAVDITEIKRAEQALRESQAQLAGIIGSARDAIISIDDNESIVLFNTAAEYMFRCSTQQVIGQPFNRFLAGDLLPEHQQPLDGIGTNGSRGVSCALYGLRADGEEFPTEASISETESNGQKSYTIILRDITERLKSEDARKESETNYRAICNSVNDAIFILDKDSGAILDVNHRMGEMYGVTAGEAKKLTFHDFCANLAPYTQEAVSEFINKAVAGDQQFFEWRAKRKGQL